MERQMAAFLIVYAFPVSGFPLNNSGSQRGTGNGEGKLPHSMLRAILFILDGRLYRNFRDCDDQQKSQQHGNG
jgi:hypothetical protein